MLLHPNGVRLTGCSRDRNRKSSDRISCEVSPDSFTVICTDTTLMLAPIRYSLCRTTYRHCTIYFSRPPTFASLSSIALIIFEASNLPLIEWRWTSKYEWLVIIKDYKAIIIDEINSIRGYIRNY